MLWEDPEKHSMGHPILVLDLLHPNCHLDTLPQRLQIMDPSSVMLKYYLVGVFLLLLLLLLLSVWLVLLWW